MTAAWELALASFGSSSDRLGHVRKQVTTHQQLQGLDPNATALASHFA